MTAIVRIALRRPYTFVVLALLLLIIGPLAASRTPVDIFPEIRIPIIAVVWNFTAQLMPVTWCWASRWGVPTANMTSVKPLPVPVVPTGNCPLA